MEYILQDHVSSDFLGRIEMEYYENLKEGSSTDRKKFEYAWCLIRSKYKSDIKKGINFLEELCVSGDPEGMRDYLFLLAVGNTKLGDYVRAKECIKSFLRAEPQNRQAKELDQLIRKKMTQGLKGAALLGTATLVVGGLVALGMSLIKK